MSVYQRYLPTLSEIIALKEPGQRRFAALSVQQADRSAREWYGAIAALNMLLQQSIEGGVHADIGVNADPGLEADADGVSPSIEGVVLSGPLPVLIHPWLVSRFSVWTLRSESSLAGLWSPLHLLPAAEEAFAAFSPTTLPLADGDPLTQEQFCLVLTPDFCLVMALQDSNSDAPAFQFSFNPEVVWQTWRSLQSRLQTTVPHMLNRLNVLVEQFAPVMPSYRTVADFAHLILDFLPDPIEWKPVAHERHSAPLRSEQLGIEPRSGVASNRNRGDRFKVKPALWDGDSDDNQVVNPVASAAKLGTALEDLTTIKPTSDAELLEAIAHEVRTPLTTIRTLTRLLLKRQDLGADVVRRLEAIDRECTKQIDRFSLIFHAVELETRSSHRPVSPLAKISVAQVFQQNIPRWQQQVQQRNLTLDVVLPQKLPMVMSDPTILNQVLTGLIDRITSTLPSGSHIQVRVMPAGNQLKLQFYSQLQPLNPSIPNGSAPHPPPSAPNVLPKFTSTLKSVGHLLMFQPETGNVSLNLAVTKNLFQALGGKLTVRQHPQQGEVLTIFLPLDGPGLLA